MKQNIFKLLLVLCVFSCDSEDAFDCIQTSGDIIQQEVTVPAFERILVNRDIELIIKEATDYKVTIETGENLLNDVDVQVVGNRLELTDNNNCNFVRDFGITKIYVETPTLKEVRTSSQYDVRSDGILSFPRLNLLSESVNESVEFTSGDFRLSVDTNDLRISGNNISFFYIDGTTNDLRVSFFSGAGRFEGANLIAQDVIISHRGSNDMIVNPQQSITGILRGTGNVISVNQPPLVDVQQIYTGQLFFN